MSLSEMDSNLADLTGDIESRIDGGEPLETIEEEILSRPDLESDKKSGLALYAWAWHETGKRANGSTRRRAIVAPVEA